MEKLISKSGKAIGYFINVGAGLYLIEPSSPPGHVTLKQVSLEYIKDLINDILPIGEFSVLSFSFEEAREIGKAINDMAWHSLPDCKACNGKGVIELSSEEEKNWCYGDGSFEEPIKYCSACGASGKIHPNYKYLGCIKCPSFK